MIALKQHLRAVHALILREMAMSHGRALGGYLWAVIEPLAAVALLAFIFSYSFASPPLGRDFALFYASGYLPFMLYVDVAQKTGVAFRFSRPLLAYPAVTWWDALVARFLLAILTHFLIVGTMMGLLVWGANERLQLDFNMLILSLCCSSLFGFSVGIINAYAFSIAPTWERFWGIFNRPLFFISGVLFLPEMLPAPFCDWLMVNPLAHVIGIFRSGTYGEYQSGSAVYVIYLSLIFAVIGLLLLCKNARRLLANG